MRYEKSFVRLRVYNVFMGFLHLAQAVAIFVFFFSFALNMILQYRKVGP